MSFIFVSSSLGKKAVADLFQEFIWLRIFQLDKVWTNDNNLISEFIVEFFAIFIMKLFSLMRAFLGVFLSKKVNITVTTLPAMLSRREIDSPDVFGCWMFQSLDRIWNFARDFLLTFTCVVTIHKENHYFMAKMCKRFSVSPLLHLLFRHPLMNATRPTGCVIFIP